MISMYVFRKTKVEISFCQYWIVYFGLLIYASIAIEYIYII